MDAAALQILTHQLTCRQTVEVDLGSSIYEMAVLRPLARPSIFTTSQEQLGLKLESAQRPLEVLVIDTIQKLSEN